MKDATAAQRQPSSEEVRLYRCGGQDPWMWDSVGAHEDTAHSEALRQIPKRQPAGAAGFDFEMTRRRQRHRLPPVIPLALVHRCQTLGNAPATSEASFAGEQTSRMLWRQ